MGAAVTVGWGSDWVPLAEVRVVWTGLALCLAIFAWQQFRFDRRATHVRVPPPVSLFLVVWASVLCVAGCWLVLFDPISDEAQSVWFRAGLGAAFAGTLGGCFWMLFYFRRTPYCDFHDAVIAEMARRIDTEEQV